MDILTVLGGKKYRSLFDNLSTEFDSSTIQEKLVTLASLNYWNLLDQTIKDYQKKYEQPKDKYILDKLKPTLQYFISHLRFDKHLPLKEFETQNLKKTISDLKVELTEKIEKQYSLTTLIESFLNGNEKAFKNENIFFKIDFQKDLTDKLKERDSKEKKQFQESYTHLYIFLKNNLIPDFKKQNFNGYPIEMGMSYQTEYLVKFYLQNPSKENYLRAIQYAVNIIYFDKEPYHQFFLFRINFSEDDIVKDFYDKNHIGVRFNSEADMDDWEKLNNRQQPKQQYVQRWKQLNQSAQENDVIVIASYRNFGSKIGVIPQGTQFDKVGNEKEFYTIFQLEEAQKIDIDKHPFIQTLLPANVTISPVKRKNYTLRKKIFPKVIVRIENNEFDDIAYEIIASEWLRTEYAPIEYRLQYQFLKTGGNKKDIDIYGMTVNNEKLIAQVSATNNAKTIDNKIQKLEKYKDFKQLFFFNTTDKKTSDYEIIDIKRVVIDLKNDPKYSGLIDELE